MFIVKLKMNIKSFAQRIAFDKIRITEYDCSYDQLMNES